nr:uncharacterized protein LOC109121118 [Solanum lycopersicum]
MEKATLIKKVFFVSFLIILIGQTINGVTWCNDSDICIKNLKCNEGHPVCYYISNMCYCRLPHDTKPFRCQTTADCARQLKCVKGVPACFASTKNCYCKLPNSKPNINEKMCKNDLDCTVLLKCSNPAQNPTCYLKTSKCYCKSPSRPPVGAPPAVNANEQTKDL